MLHEISKLISNLSRSALDDKIDWWWSLSNQSRGWRINGKKTHGDPFIKVLNPLQATALVGSCYRQTGTGSTEHDALFSFVFGDAIKPVQQCGVDSNNRSIYRKFNRWVAANGSRQRTIRNCARLTDQRICERDAAPHRSPPKSNDKSSGIVPPPPPLKTKHQLRVILINSHDRDEEM